MSAAAKYETCEIEVCSDCLMMMANGEIGDVSEAETEAHAAAMDAAWPMSEGWHLSPDHRESDDDTFSWQSCEGCKSSLGGDRHAAVAMRKVDAAPK